MGREAVRRIGRRAALCTAAAAAVLITAAATKPAPEPRTRVGEDVVELLDAFTGNLALRAWQANPDPRVAYARAPLCNMNSQYLTPEIEGTCAPPDGTVAIPGCGDDEPVEPLWRRTRSTPTSTDWSVWEMLSGWAVPTTSCRPSPKWTFDG